MLTLLTVAVIGTHGLAVSAQRSPILGDWAARLDIGGRPHVLWLKVAEAPGNELVASVWINPSLDASRPSIFSNIKVVRLESSWTLATGSDVNSLRLEVRQSEGGIVATYQVRADSGKTQLWRAPTDPTANRLLKEPTSPHPARTLPSERALTEGTKYSSISKRKPAEAETFTKSRRVLSREGQPRRCRLPLRERSRSRAIPLTASRRGSAAKQRLPGGVLSTYEKTSGFPSRAQYLAARS